MAPTKVQQVTAGETGAGQRLDNFLAKLLKDVPKTHIFRLIRKGEVRVNGKRAKPDQRSEHPEDPTDREPAAYVEQE